MTARLLKQGYRYHKIRKVILPQTLRVVCELQLKTLLQQGISQSEFFGDLVYKFKRIVGNPSFNDRFKKVTKRYENGYNMDIMRPSAILYCLVVYVIPVYSYVFLFNCTRVDQASDSMTVLA